MTRPPFILALAACALIATACDTGGGATELPLDTGVDMTTPSDADASVDTATTSDTLEPEDVPDAVVDTATLADVPGDSDARRDTADLPPPIPPPAVGWRQVDVSDISARWAPMVAWLDDSSAFVFGGVDANHNVRGDLRRIDVADDGTLSTTNLTTSDPDMPVPRYAGCMAYDPAGKRLLLVGGRSFTEFFPGTWSFDAISLHWEKITSSPTEPSWSYGCAMAHSAHTGDFYLFGGTDSETASGETWRFDPDTSTWIRLEITGPAARYDAGMRSLDGGRSLLMFAGTSGAESGLMADVWRFDTELELWQPIDTSPGAATPPGRRTPWMVTTPDDAFLIAGFGIVGLQPGDVLGDLWALDLARGQWTELELDGVTPPARGFAPALPGGESGLGLLLDGSDLDTLNDDGWLLEAL